MGKINSLTVKSQTKLLEHHVRCFDLASPCNGTMGEVYARGRPSSDLAGGSSERDAVIDPEAIEVHSVVVGGMGSLSNKAPCTLAKLNELIRARLPRVFIGQGIHLDVSPLGDMLGEPHDIALYAVFWPEEPGPPKVDTASVDSMLALVMMELEHERMLNAELRRDLLRALRSTGTTGKRVMEILRADQNKRKLTP